MLILKNGGSALDAVEAAIKTLEDREITNAGYGSNLAMDGVVECDASVVDHYGRSGAVGAVARKCLATQGGGPVLTIMCRNQESYIPSTNGPRPHHESAYAASSSSKPLGIPGRHRFRCRNGYADPAPRCTHLSRRERTLDAMALRLEGCRAQVQEE
jgi:hypothetical protein